MADSLQSLVEFDSNDDSIPPPADTDSFVRRHNEIVGDSFFQNVPCENLDTQGLIGGENKLFGRSITLNDEPLHPDALEWIRKVKPRLTQDIQGKLKVQIENSQVAFIKPDELVAPELAGKVEKETEEPCELDDRYLDLWVPMEGPWFTQNKAPLVKVEPSHCHDWMEVHPYGLQLHIPRFRGLASSTKHKHFIPIGFCLLIQPWPPFMPFHVCHFTHKILEVKGTHDTLVGWRVISISALGFTFTAISIFLLPESTSMSNI